MQGRRGRNSILGPALAVAVGLLLCAAPTAGAAGLPGRCTIKGTAAEDVLRGTPRSDVICGTKGDDRILGRAGDDVIDGGPGDDRIAGGRGRDTMFGGRGGDRFDTEAEDGVVDGGPGRDRGERPPPSGSPQCPAIAPMCEFSVTMVFKRSDTCTSYLRASEGSCTGATLFGSPGWDAVPSKDPGARVEFSWKQRPDGTRDVHFQTFKAGSQVGEFVGTGPAPKAAIVITPLYVSSAQTNGWAHPEVVWCTGTSGQPGREGAPLDSGWVPATETFYIDVKGFLKTPC